MLYLTARNAPIAWRASAGEGVSIAPTRGVLQKGASGRTSDLDRQPAFGRFRHDRDHLAGREPAMSCKISWRGGGYDAAAPRAGRPDPRRPARRRRRPKPGEPPLRAVPTGPPRPDCRRSLRGVARGRAIRSPSVTDVLVHRVNQGLRESVGIDGLVPG